MRKALIAGVATLGLAACADTQTTLRKAGYDAIQAYNATAPLAVAYEGNSAADPAIKARIKAASADAMKVITPLGADLQSGNVLTALEISAATAAVARLEAQVATKGTAQ